MKKLTNRIDFLLDNPRKVLISDIPLLQNEVKKHPYFYSLHALLLFGLKQENHPSFEDNLKITSLYSTNRVDLYNYIISVKDTDSIEKKEVTAYNIEKSEVSPFLVEENKPIVKLQKETQKETEVSVEAEIKPEIIAKEETVTNIVETIVEEKVEVETQLEEIITKEEVKEEIVTNAVETLVQADLVETKIEETETKPKAEEIIAKEVETNIVEAELEEIIETKPEIEEIIEIRGEEVIEVETFSAPADQNKTFTFSEWLLKNKKESEKEELNERDIKYKLINDFLEKPPKLTPKKDAEIFNYSEEINSAGREFSDLMTETLAQIYTEQRKFDKAIRAYKILSLKYPEKNTYFANRISEIENLKSSK